MGPPRGSFFIGKSPVTLKVTGLFLFIAQENVYPESQRKQKHGSEDDPTWVHNAPLGHEALASRPHHTLLSTPHSYAPDHRCLVPPPSG